MSDLDPSQKPLRYLHEHLAAGTEVVAREPAIGPHPRTHAPTVYQSVDKVLLASGAELYICNHCGYCRTGLQSVVAHQAGKHPIPKSGRRQYDELTAKAVIRAVMQAKRTRGSDFAVRAAATLNNQGGVHTLNGQPWTSSTVSRVYNAYVEVYPNVQAAGRPRGSKNRPKASDAGNPKVQNLALLGEVNSLRTIAKHVVREALALESRLDTLLERVEGGEWSAVVVDPEVIEKARHWDQMKAAFLS